MNRELSIENREEAVFYLRLTIDDLLLPLCHLLGFRSRMSFEHAGRREFTKLMSDHVLGNENRYVAFAVVNAKRQTNHCRRDRRTSRPCADRLRLCSAFGDLPKRLLQAQIDERSFF